MSRRLSFFGGAVALALVAAVTGGCVDRRFVIEGDPPGALVYVNGNPIGFTPTDLSFTYYGKYRFVFVRDGFETLTVDEQFRTPWWSYFPLEFVVESIIPWTIRDVRYIRYPLQQRAEISDKAILDRAEQLRAQGKTLGPPQACAPAIVPPGAAAVPPPQLPTADPPSLPPPGMGPGAPQQLPPQAGPGTPVPMVPPPAGSQ
jgi:hypothetical protein